MNFIDYLIISILLICIIKGFVNGAIKTAITFVGGFIVIIAAYLLKNPVSLFLYDHLPFFKLGGLLSGISVFNIIIYELLSFLIVASVLLIIYRVILSITNVIEKILKITIILAIPSKLIGLVVGFVEGIVVNFIVLFVLLQFASTKEYVKTSKYGEIILTSTPILSDATKDIYKSLDEIYKVADDYKESTDRNAANLEALNIILKYKLIDPKTAKKLINEKKLEIDGSEKIIEKYTKIK